MEEETRQEKKKYWLKLDKDFLKSPQMKVLKNMQNGKDYIIFYLSLMLESVETVGHLRFTSLVPYNDEMLSAITDTNVDIVRQAVKIFCELGLMQIFDDGTIFMPNVPQMTGKESESAERVRRYREKLKKHEIKTLQCNADVTKCNDNKEKEEEKEKEKKENKYKEIIDIYNTYCTNMPRVEKLTEKRKVAINKFLKEFSLDEFQQVCVIANNSDFLIGDNDRNWKADFDFLLRTDKATAIIEGKYNTKKKDKLDNFKELWEEARLDDEQARNGTSNNPFGW